jgi:hypothetical protein
MPGPLTIWILGPPGSGKTTYLASLLRELKRGKLPPIQLERNEREPGLEQAINHLENSYPVRATQAIAWRCRLRIAGQDDTRGQDWFCADLVLHDEPGGALPLSGTPDGVLVLLPPLAGSRQFDDEHADSERVLPPLATLTPTAPVALILTQADRVHGDERTPADRLRDDHPGWVAALAARRALSARFACSSFGYTHEVDPAQPPVDGRPFGLAEPLAWILRTIHDENWKTLNATSRQGDIRRTTLLASDYLAAFPESPHRREVERLRAEGRRPTFVSGLIAWLALAALLLSLWNLTQQLRQQRAANGVASASAAPAQATNDHERILRSALANACQRRAEGLTNEEPQTVEACEELLSGWRFIIELTQLDPANPLLADLRARAREALASTAERRERLIKLRAAESAKDWPELLTLIDELWRQESHGPAHESAKHFRQRFWHPWAARTQGLREGHLDVAGQVEAFIRHSHDLVEASRLLSAELNEARRFLNDRWQWERFYRGGWFDGIVVVAVMVHRDNQKFRESDGSASLMISFRGKTLVQQNFNARSPNEDWYRYELGNEIALEVPPDGGELTVSERDLFSTDTARFRFARPVELFNPGSSQRSLPLDTGEGKDHLRLLLEFKHAERYRLANLEQQ